MHSTDDYPENPVLARIVRGERIESQHRGAWALVDTDGNVLDGRGAWERPVFARSSCKSLQALPLLESGAADRFGLEPEDIALALASHNAEPCHTERVEALLARLGLSVAALGCGPQPPGDPQARAALGARGLEPTALDNNCSGKHAGFLALCVHLGEDPARYLEPDSRTQGLVRAALLEMTGTAPEELYVAVDGCSAPTFRLPLAKLATGIARVATPDGLAPERRRACERMLSAVAEHPALIAGHHQRLCTDLARASAGRLFPKIGAEGVYVVGVRGAHRGLAVKIDDGGARGLAPVVLELLERFGFASEPELLALASWRSRRIENWAGKDVGRLEVTA